MSFKYFITCSQVRKIAIFYIFQMLLYFHLDISLTRLSSDFVNIPELMNYTQKKQDCKGNHQKQTGQSIHKIVQSEARLTGALCKHLKAIPNKELANPLQNCLYSIKSGLRPISGHNIQLLVFDSLFQLSSFATKLIFISKKIVPKL